MFFLSKNKTKNGISFKEASFSLIKLLFTYLLLLFIILISFEEKSFRFFFRIHVS